MDVTNDDGSLQLSRVTVSNVRAGSVVADIEFQVTPSAVATACLQGCTQTQCRACTRTPGGQCAGACRLPQAVNTPQLRPLCLDGPLQAPPGVTAAQLDSLVTTVTTTPGELFKVGFHHE
jgi:hypothetical protein